jgi:hypothetical protein
MSSHASLAAVALMLSAAAATFVLKYEVRKQENEVARLHDAIVEQRWVRQTLRADLAFLTRPDRITMQAIQTGMVPLRPDRLASIVEIPRDDQFELAGHAVPFSLPTGGTLELKFKPYQLVGLSAGSRP